MGSAGNSARLRLTRMSSLRFHSPFSFAVRVAGFAVASFVLGADTAQAYIDPNAGGLLYQLLFPLLIAIAGAWAVLRQKIRELFSALAARFRRKSG